MIVIDTPSDARLRPANDCDTSGSPSRKKVASAASLVGSQFHISGLFFSSCVANQPLSVTAEGLVESLTTVGWGRASVFRFAGNEEAEARRLLAEWGARSSIPSEVFRSETTEWEAAKRLRDLMMEVGG